MLYSRDELTEPLRQLGHVLLWVKVGDLLPDEGRAGRWHNHPRSRVPCAAPGYSAADHLGTRDGATLRVAIKEGPELSTTAAPQGTRQEKPSEEERELVEDLQKHFQEEPESDLDVGSELDEAEAVDSDQEDQEGQEAIRHVVKTRCDAVGEEAKSEKKEREREMKPDAGALKRRGTEVLAAEGKRRLPLPYVSLEDLVHKLDHSKAYEWIPPGLKGMRHKTLGTRHWTDAGVIPICKGHHNPDMYTLFEGTTGKMCKKCPDVASRECGVVHTEKYVR